MAMRISISKTDKQPSLLGRLPRFNLDLRVNNKKIEVIYAPAMETLIRAWKEKKGILTVAEEQFKEFKKAPLKKKKSTSKSSK